MGIDDAYHVERTLARGPYGVTELVTIDGVGPFVRKKIPSALAQRSIWASLNGLGCDRIPHVAAMYELPDCFAVIIEYVPGETLSQYLDGHGTIGVDEAVALTMQICESILAVHHAGILHRDITPANVIVANDGAHIIDFGIARELSHESHGDRDTTVLGTYGFAAPEQYGFARTDVRSDVYSIGRILGTMLTGMFPDAENYESALNRTLSDKPDLHAIIKRACAFEPSARYQSADDLLEALRSGRDTYEAGYDTVQNHGNGMGTAKKTTAVPPHHAVRVMVIAVVAILIVIVSAMMLTIGVPFLSDHANTLLSSGQQGDMSSQTSPGTADATDGMPKDGKTKNDETKDSTAPDDDAVASGNPLELVETGWSAEDGFVSYAVGLRNTSDSVNVEFPSIEITGYDDQDDIIFSDTQVLRYAFAGQTTYFSGLAGDGVAPARVDFSILDPQSHELDSSTDAVVFSVSDTKEIVTDNDGITFTGRIGISQNNTKIQESSSVNVSLVLRDADGSIIGGQETFVDWPPAGGTRPFSIKTYGLPDYASYEIHAQIW